MNNVITKNNDEVVNNLFDKIEGIIVSGRNKAIYEVEKVIKKN